MASLAEGERVTLDTVVVCKRRFRRLGLRLVGDHHPRVHSSTHPSFRTGDVLYVINGRQAVGARQTAQRIWYETHLSITMWRRV
jgi:hypothetical protein